MKGIILLLMLALACNGCAAAAGAAIGGLIGTAGGLISNTISGPEKKPEGVAKEDVEATKRGAERLNDFTPWSQGEMVKKRQQEASEQQRRIEQAEGGKAEGSAIRNQTIVGSEEVKQ